MSDQDMRDQLARVATQLVDLAEITSIRPGPDGSLELVGRGQHGGQSVVRIRAQDLETVAEALARRLC